MNINKVIFSRTAPAKKIEIVKSLSDAEVLSITPDTTKRILKEVGRKLGKTRDREMRIAYERRNGNAWNSTIESVELIKNRLYVCLYVQFSNTDTTQSEEYEDFFARGNYRGEIHRTDRFGNPRTYYYIYDTEAKANVAKAILLEYVYTKYANKLNDGRED
ncbi:MAG: hypothetical protein IJV33_07710 [Bacteroidaceae bacterium]|nr:hypothetical protein [Bacteroidaceae bacterium]